MTTRIKTIAEKCEIEQGTHVYKQSFSYEDAERLSHTILTKCVEEDILEANAKGLSAQITYMCGTVARGSSCPLAVICLSSAWANSHAQCEYREWDTWNDWVRKVLLDRFLSTASFKPLIQSLSLGFDDLPVDLKTCLLYCSMYPCESWDYQHRIEREWLVRKWIAEGFVLQEEVAQAYFDKLVSRDLLQPVLEKKYRVDPMMLSFLVCKSKENDFVACIRYNGPRPSHTKQLIPRLSLYCMDRYPHEEASHIRSLAFHGHHSQLDDVSFIKFENLRVLDFDSSGGLENRHLVDICQLFWLRYLGLNGCHQITELPWKIGRLQNLETLAAKGSSISKLPMEIEKLQNLESLNISDTRITELPREVGKLQNLESLNISDTRITELPREVGKLQNLERLNISNTKVMELPREIWELQHLEALSISNTRITELPREIWKLQHLRTMDIRMTKVRELYWEVPNSLTVIAGSMDTAQEHPNSLTVIAGSMDTDEEQKVCVGPACKNSIISSSGAKCREDISIVVLINYYLQRCEILNIPMHRLAGRHLNVPEWVKQDLSYISTLDIRLCKLGEADLEFLKKMPNLQALQLRLEVLPRKPIAMTGGGFLKLETFYFDCRLPRVTFQTGATMPVLKRLQFKFYTGTASLDYSMGIMNLPSLKNVVFRCSEYYTSDSQGISRTIEVVRKEAVEHPNEITIWVNEMEPEVFGSGTRWISQADKAIIEQREQLHRAAESRRERGKNTAKGGNRS